MGFEPTTFCMARKTAGNDPGRRKTREAAFLHEFPGARHRDAAPLHEVDVERLGH
jgi:hypothetical protein